MSLKGVDSDLLISLVLIGVLFTGFEILMAEQIAEIKMLKELKELRKITRKIKFTIKSKNNLSKEFYKILSDDIIIGRKDEFSHMSIDDEFISSVHSKISLEYNNVYVEDLNSDYGTFLNGNRVKDYSIVRDGDVLLLGDTEIVISLSDFV